MSSSSFPPSLKDADKSTQASAQSSSHPPTKSSSCTGGINGGPSAAGDEESVQPSTQLINLLHRKLRDPSIVPAFERHRSRRLIEGLVRPCWVLRHAGEIDAGAAGINDAGVTDAEALVNNAACKNNGEHANNTKDSGGINREVSASGNDASGPLVATPVPIKDNYVMGNNIGNCSLGKNKNGKESAEKECQRYNTIPKRNYIDLRMEQNKMFADSQCIQCQNTISKLQSSSSLNSNKQWKKLADTCQSLLNEGLAACPNHEGLLTAEKEYKGWIQQRINLLSGGDTATMPSVPNPVIRSKTSNDTKTSNNITKAQLPNPYLSQPKKGAEGRAQAAMRDALMERSFLLGDACNEKSDVQYPLLSANDEVGDVGVVRKEDNDVQQDNGRDANSSNDSSSDQESRRRSRSKRRSKHKHKKHKRGKQRHHDRRKRNRERSLSRRSRSESRSVSSRSRSHSRSVSSSRSIRSSSYRRRRKHHRKEKKQRRSKHRRKSREERHHSEDGVKEDCFKEHEKLEARDRGGSEP